MSTGKSRAPDRANRQARESDREQTGIAFGTNLAHIPPSQAIPLGKIVAAFPSDRIPVRTPARRCGRRSDAMGLLCVGTEYLGHLLIC
jgi:hypothetical protein